MRLHLKISLWTVAILMVVGGISIFALYTFQRRAALQQFEHMAQTLTATILNSLEITMAHNNQEEIQEIIRRITREPMIADVTIYGRAGRVWAPRARAGQDAGPLAEAVACAIASCQRVRFETAAHDLVVITPVENKAACAGCHAQDPSVLGAIGVSLRTAPITAQLAASARWLAVLVGFSFLLALGMLNLLLGRFVLDPLASLAVVVRRVAAGEYRARAPVHRQDELGMLARSVNEMAAQIDRSTEALNARIRDLTQRLAGFGALGRALNEAADLAPAVEEALRGVAGMLDADGAGLYLLEDGALRLAHRWGAGLPAVLADAGGPRAALAGRGGMRVVQGDSHRAVGCSGRDVPAGLAGCGAVALAPLRVKERTLGTLVLARRPVRPFDEADLTLLGALADQLAVALENVRLFQQVRAHDAARGELVARLITAQEDERRRIARELHDEVSQSLTGVMIGIRAAAQSAAAADLRRRLEGVYTTAERTLEEVGKIVQDLRPTSLDDLGLVSAVRVHARNLLEAAGVRLTFEASGFGHRRLRPEVEVTAFRVAQEAITNVARHARATEAVVSLQVRVGELVVRVEDNGVGLDPAEIERAGCGVGLTGMRERAALIGGRLEVASAPGRGTAVRLTVPLDPEHTGGSP